MNTYAYVGGNPLKFIDPYGLNFGFGVDPNGAGGNGHTSLYFQDPSGNWNAYNQGAAGTASSGGNNGFLAGSNANSGVSIGPILTPPKGTIIYPSNPDDDNNISQCATTSQQNHNNGKIPYNLYNNNCTDAVVDVLACAGWQVNNPPLTIRPNAWFDQLLNNPPTRYPAQSPNPNPMQNGFF